MKAPPHTQQLQVSLDGKTVGALASSARGELYFQYDPTWLREGFDIAPHTMAFGPAPQLAQQGTFDGLHGVFHDSLPDGWGLLLMDRALQHGLGWARHDITLLDRLAYVGPRAFGALSYAPVLAPQASADDTPNTDTLSLALLAQQAQKVLAGHDAEVLPALMLHGGSPGGARPKVSVARNPSTGHCVSGFAPLQPGYMHWMVKFPAPGDGNYAGHIEYVYARLARLCGLHLPAADLIETAAVRGSGRGTSRAQSFFAVQRFDREGDTRIHMLSLCAHLYASHRAPSLDYEHFLAATWRLTQDITQVQQAFRRMVFNVVMHNRDDHSKNFAYLYLNGVWVLSPAYDLSFSQGVGHQHTCAVNGNGVPTRQDLLAVAKRCALKNAGPVIDEIVHAACAWGPLADKQGIPQRERHAVAKAIEAQRQRLM
jgi:serine/threonine-protein kinase HipA